MKDFKFKDIKGKENDSVFYQYDQFELPSGVPGFFDRWIFGFDKAIRDSNWSTNSLGYHNDQLKNTLFNLSAFSGVGGAYTGAPGSAQIYLNNKPYSSNVSAYDNIPTTKNVTGELDIFSFNEDGLLILDIPVSSTLGTTATNPIKHYRSGYIEFTIKTDKSNCFIGMGTIEKQYPAKSGYQTTYDDPTIIDSSNSYINHKDDNNSETRINLNNGKVEFTYIDKYGNNQKTFSLIGNTTISDNQWHHVVVNIGRPGTIREHGQKFNKRFIEIWVDGQLDNRTDELVNDEQIFFNLIEWLFVDPTIAKKVDGPESGYNTYDEMADLTGLAFGYKGLNEFNRIFNYNFHPDSAITAFRGAVDTFVMGINVALSKFDIKERYRLWRGFDKFAVDKMIANASMVNPIITTNKKKALKLFWNNLINENCKNGLELDNTFSVESYSITHKLANSNTEVNNIDLANEKQIKFLSDVKIVLTDNVMLWGPGRDYLLNKEESTKLTFGYENQSNAKNLTQYDSLTAVWDSNGFNPNYDNYFPSQTYMNLYFSNVSLTNGDRILLTNQFNKRDNGVYIFNGMGNPITRATDSVSPDSLNNAVVRVIDGKYKNTSWILLNEISSFNDDQNWIQLEYHPDSLTLGSQPLFGSRWSTSVGKERFINLEEDLDISRYDVITFMNYPDTNEEILEHFIGYDAFEIKVMYQDFLKSLQNVVANGASLFVSSPKLALDLGLVQDFELVDQSFDEGDAQSSSISPFEVNEDATEYFDTHRINQYHLATEVPGLTDKETFILTDFINYVPTDVNKFQQYHAKYAYRQFGLQEGNEFFIPSLTLRKATENDKLPGFSGNRKGSKPLCVFEPHHVNTGTIVTKMQNTYYDGSNVTTNDHDDDVSTFIVHNGQLLNGQPITGKIFVNCVEDHYTMSREEYNKAVFQDFSNDDINENINTVDWQYSTTRLDRLPRKVNIRQLSELGQTTPTTGGGGPAIQAPSNSSNGVIRSQTDAGNKDRQSDLYPSIEEERYPTFEVPVLSMTWLGLQWLAE